MKGACLLALPAALFLAAGLVLIGAASGRPAQAGLPSTCQPVEGVVLGYTPTLVYPETPVLFAAELLTASLPITYTWSFGDATAPLGGTTASPAFTVTHAYTAAGLYTLTLTVWNSCTLPPLTATARVTVTARPCLPPTGLALTYTPTQVYTFTPVLFIGEVLTGSLPVSYTWAFGDGTPPMTGMTDSPLLTATHRFTATGIYSTWLTAWNLCTVTPTQQAVTLAIAPCESIAGAAIAFRPAVPHAGEVITFTAAVTGGTPLRAFAWAFGDGETATGPVVTHIFTAPLTYTVVLTAGNPCSRRIATATVAVAPPPLHLFLPLALRNLAPPPWPAHLGYGAVVASADHVLSLTVMGFDWAKGLVSWESSDPTYDWANVDNQLRELVPYVRHVLLTVIGPPPPGVGNPPVSPADLAAFYTFTLALSAHVSETWRGQGLETVAYEIWNEPNLDYEWGGAPDAAQYTALLKAGYRGVKAGDPHALVVSAGLATTGGSAADLAWARHLYGAERVVPDLTFLREMYRAGARGYLDALGSHPYGGSYPPDTPPDQVTLPIYFRRAEEQQQVMREHGDSSPVWATEFGWVLATDCDLGEHEWMEVGEEQQAEYLAAAYAYADEEWPWMGPMFLFNLDHATVDWYAGCDPVRWYSITYREDPQAPGPIRPRLAFFRLRDMPKRSAW